MIFKRNNKGISYIEVILVLTIMILMTGFASVTMAIVNRNNATKGADRIESGFNHAKTLSLSKGSSKGCITFAANGNKCYYYYGDNKNDKYIICNSPCTVTVYANSVDEAHAYNISGSTEIRYCFNQSTGAVEKAQISIGGSSFTDIVGDTNSFVVSPKDNNKIVVDNHHGKSINLYLSVHVGKVSISY